MRLHTRKMWSTFSETSKLVLNKGFFKGFFTYYLPQAEKNREKYLKKEMNAGEKRNF